MRRPCPQRLKVRVPVVEQCRQGSEAPSFLRLLRLFAAAEVGSAPTRNRSPFRLSQRIPISPTFSRTLVGSPLPKLSLVIAYQPTTLSRL